MLADLDQFESQLQAHFEHLADEKRSRNQPLFALEHCLDTTSVQLMRSLLKKNISQHGMCDSFKHCWLVHAAEHGYTFEGLEFWQSFAALTPQWEQNNINERVRLRRWFYEFSKNYNGVKPTGRWGQHFTYIAWPITHALLPSDLQIQLARALFSIRYHFDKLYLSEYESVGRMLARFVNAPTPRFMHFLEQYELVGRVVFALLEDTPKEPVIYSPTLNRITDDLNARRNARAWLQDARKCYERSIAKFAASDRRYSLIPSSQAVEKEQVDSEISTREVLLIPRLQLVRLAKNKWEAQLLIPSFQALVGIKPQFRDHLARVRFSIPAHGNALFMGQSLLSGRLGPKKLITWPNERKPLLKFNEIEVNFDRIVETECQMPPSKLWVFQCQEDGFARHLLSQHVRAGQNYVVVSRDSSLLEGLGKSVDLNCTDASAVSLEIPEIVSAELSSALKRAHIALHSHLLIEPVGLRPRQWSEDGLGEWFTTETPLFALVCEYDVDSYYITLNKKKNSEIPRATGNEPTLIALRDLPIGHHHISICALKNEKCSSGTKQTSIANADIELYVRNPTAWSPSTQFPEAMMVDVVPSVPSLDDFLEQRLKLRIEGDEARSATCQLILTSSATGEESAFQILAAQIPVSTDVWLRYLDTFLGQLDELSLVNASQAAISVQAQDLGEIRIPLYFEVEPLHWALKKSRSFNSLYLVDEGVTDQVSVTFYEFDHPCRGKAVDVQCVTQGIECSSDSGMYVAIAGDLCVAIVVATQNRVHSFSTLGAQVNRTELENENTTEQLINKLKLWQSARASSHMARLKQHSVCRAIRSQLLTRVCGVLWARLEEELTANDSNENWARLEEAVSNPISFSISLVHKWAINQTDATFDPYQCFHASAERFNISKDTELTALAWHVASSFTEVDTTKLAEATSTKHFSILVRGARLLILCRDKQRRLN